MYRGKSMALILPARNEALALPAVLAAVPSFVDRVVVVDNGSTDATALVARDGGAEVVSEPTPGYGLACLAGIAFLKSAPPDIIAFADADGSDDLPSLAGLLDLLAREEADFALARRIPSDPEALTLQQRFGNRLATFLIGRCAPSHGRHWSGSACGTGASAGPWKCRSRHSRRDCG